MQHLLRAYKLELCTLFSRLIVYKILHNKIFNRSVRAFRGGMLIGLVLA